jgi:hypothetical protein
MATLDEIRARLAARQYLLSKHAADQMIGRDIAAAEVEQAILGPSEVIEDYPSGKYGPSCLILGYTDAGRPLHVQCAYPDLALVKIVTVYEPDPSRWTDMRTRRRE